MRISVIFAALDLEKAAIFKQKTLWRAIPHPERSCWLFSDFPGS
jgi:hypothetical protein